MLSDLLHGDIRASLFLSLKEAREGRVAAEPEARSGQSGGSSFFARCQVGPNFGAARYNTR